MRPPTCSDCAHWQTAIAMPALPDRACLRGYKLVQPDTVADMTCFERITRGPGAASAGTPRE